MPQVIPGIWAMSQTRGGRVHAYILDDGNGLTLIDTLYDNDASRILDALAAMDKTPTDIHRIVITHGHRSHLGGLAAIKKLSGAPVYAEPWEAGIIAGYRKAVKPGIRPGRPHHPTVYGLQLALNAGFGKHVPCEVDCSLIEGRRVGPLEVVALPGHTQGSTGFYWPEKRALFAGDVIATWPPVRGMAAYPGWDGFTLDQPAHERSVGKLADFSDAEILCVGHGPAVTEGAADVLRGLRK